MEKKAKSKKAKPTGGLIPPYISEKLPNEELEPTPETQEEGVSCSEDGFCEINFKKKLV